MKGIFRLLGVFVCCFWLVACSSLPARSIPQTIGITQTNLTNPVTEYVFCDLKGGAWRCENTSLKTPVNRRAEIKPHQTDAYAVLPRRAAMNAAQGPLLTVFFDFNSAAVSAEQALEIIGLVKIVKDAEKIKVTGFTDNVGSELYNGFLAQRRANAVRRLLMENGIAPERIRAFGKGKCCYVDDNRLTSGRAKNRRVTISL